VKEDLFMHSSCIEHFVIRAKLMDLNELELIGVTQWKASSHTRKNDLTRHVTHREAVFGMVNMLALATETIETHPDLDHWELAKR